MATEKYNGIERYIFADLYNFYLTYRCMPDLDMSWEACLAKADALNKKYKNHPLARAILTEIINLLDAEIHHKPIRSKNGIELTHDNWEKLLSDSHYFEKF